jgi:hypothetical protein
LTAPSAACTTTCITTSMDSIDHHVRKAITYSGLFVQERLSAGDG